MARFKRPRFERLTRQAPLASGKDADDAQAVAALLSLGELRCEECGKRLEADLGFACCDNGYCPLCGEEVDGSIPCGHLVFTFKYNWRQWDDVPLYRLWEQAHQGRTWEDWTALKALTPPARRLPGQKGSGYPRWSPEQLAAAYAPEVQPHLSAVFEPTLRQFSWPRLAPVLLTHLQPDLRTTTVDDFFYRRDHYFSADYAQALDRVVTFLTQVKEGTERLRAMPPETFVRHERA